MEPTVSSEVHGQSIANGSSVAVKPLKMPRVSKLRDPISIITDLVFTNQQLSLRVEQLSLLAEQNAMKLDRLREQLANIK